MDDDRVKAAEAVAHLWNDLEIPYVVMHGVEAYPDRLGRDLDILMDSWEAGKALEHAATLLTSLGWRIACPPPLWGPRLVALKGSDAGSMFEYLELHTMNSLRWRALTLVDQNETANNSIGPFRISSWATFAKTVLTPLLAGDLSRFDSDYLAGLDVARVTKDVVMRRGSDVFGEVLPQRLVSAVDNRDPEEMKALAGPLHKAAIRQMLRHPVRTGQTLPALVLQKALRLVSYSGIKARIGVPSHTNAVPVVKAVVDQIRHVFVTIEVSGPKSLLHSCRQRYRTLSRQGLVLELHETSSESAWEVTMTGASRIGSGPTGETTVAFSPDSEHAIAGKIARLLVEQWWTRYACPQLDDREGHGNSL